MTEPTRPAPPPATSKISVYIDVLLYVTAAVTYISLSIYNKWLLDWIVGPLWLVAWVWGLPAIVKLILRQPVRPRRNPLEPPEEPE